MKKLFALICMAAMVSIPMLNYANTMTSYCSTPPFVTSTVPPNIMILLDNSKDMLKSAYIKTDDDYVINGSYEGYFENDEYYEYKANHFEISLDSPGTPPIVTDPVSGETAPKATYVTPAGKLLFLGRFLNWITTSRFDLLMKVLIGGKATSRQGNDHTLVSESDKWDKKYKIKFSDGTKYESGCKFKVRGGTFTVEDEGGGIKCPLLYEPPTAISFNTTPSELLPDSEQTALASSKTEGDSYWSRIMDGLVPDAFAAKPVRVDTSNLADAYIGNPYTEVLEAKDGTEPYSWSLIPSATTGNISVTVGNRPDSLLRNDVPPGSFIDDGFKVGDVVYTTSLETKNQGPLIVTEVTAAELFLKTIDGSNLSLTNETSTITVWAESLPPGLEVRSVNTGAISVTFNDTNNTMTRSLGDFITDGFEVGDVITTNSANGKNDGPFLISAITGTVLTVTDSNGKDPDLEQKDNPETVSIHTGMIKGTPASQTCNNEIVDLSVTFDDAKHTITRSAGSFITDNGLQKDQIITTSSANLNNQGPFVIDKITDTELTVKNAEGHHPDLVTGTEVVTITSDAPCTYYFTIQVTDDTGGTATRDLSIEVGRIVSKILGPFKVRIEPPGGAGTEQRGIIHEFLGFARWGLMDFRKDKPYVEQEIKERSTTSDIASFVNDIQNVSAEAKAPLARGYGAIMDYLMGKPPGSNDKETWNGPASFTDPFKDDTVPCRKTFVLTLSSVKNVKGKAKDHDLYTDETCFDNPDKIYYTCKSGHLHDTDADGKELITYSCFAYKNDLRSATLGVSEKGGNQNLYHYGVYTFGDPDDGTDVSDIDDIGCLDPSDPAYDPLLCETGEDSPRAKNKAILKAATRAGGGMQEGRNQFFDASESGASLKDKITLAITEILKRAASGTSVSVLTTSSRGVGSVVQAYFLPVRQDGTREVSWTGYLQNIWIDPQDNLRDDSSGAVPEAANYKLELDKDNVMKLYFNSTTNQTEAGMFTTDADGSGGTLGSCTDPPRKAFDLITTLWEAGRKLALDDHGTRNIYTSTKVLRNTSGGTVDLFASLTPGDKFTMSDMIEEQEAALNIPAAGAAVGDPATWTRSNIVDYVRGKDLEATDPGDFRDRQITVDGSLKVWKLGDIISSTPKVLANTPLHTYHILYSDLTYASYTSSTAYKQRSSIAYVGANDGMLHAFRVGHLKDTGLVGSIKAVFHKLFSTSAEPTGTTDLGEEVWAYIPLNAFPYLKYLASNEYCHIYYNDLSVKTVDVSIGGNAGDPKATDGTSWKTVLIGGMRFGGACSGADANPSGPPTGTPANVGYSSYFAIDITNPEVPVPLWEFSDEDMGHTTSLPTVLRTGNPNNNGNWYAVFGSGSKVLVDSTTDVGRTTAGYVYLLDLKTGALVQKIPLGHNAIVGDVLAVDGDYDYKSEKLYFGTAFKDVDTWKGKIMSIAIPDQDLTTWTPASPAYTELFAGDYPFTASPDATKDEYGDVWVYAGSGKYYSDMDEADTSQQIFFGLKDDPATLTYPASEGSTTAVTCPTGGCPADSLCDTTNCTTTGTVADTVEVCDYDKTDNSFKKRTIVTAITGGSTGPTPVIGWKTYLTGGERVISRPLAVGGLVDFLTYVPNADDCAFGGDSYLYSLGYTSGVAPTNIAIRAYGTTVDSGGNAASSGDVTVRKGVLLGPGAPPTGEAIIIPPQKEGQEKLKKKIQVATGVIVETENKPVISTTSKIIHWLKK